MKSINKESLKTDKEANNCVVERTILEKLKSDFVVKLHFAFQTPEKNLLCCWLFARGRFVLSSPEK